MPIYVNDKQVSIEQIRTFKGEDRVMNDLRKNLSYIDKRMRKGNKDLLQTISLVWSPGVRKYNKLSRLKDGKKMVSIVFQHTMPTPQGTRVVRWCEQAIPQANGVIKYLPTRFKFTKVRMYDVNNIEQLLWLITFAPSIRLEMADGEIINANAPITVEDIGLDQRRVATERRIKGRLGAYIYSEFSPITDDMMRTLASAWGVSKATDFDVDLEMIRNQLNDKVMFAQNKRDKRYDIEAFIDAVEERSDFFKVLLLIQSGLDLGIIEWQVSGLRWVYIDNANADILEICRVPVSERQKYRDFLADYLIRNRAERTKLDDVVKFQKEQKEDRMADKEEREVKPFADKGAETEDEMRKRLKDEIFAEIKKSEDKEEEREKIKRGFIDDKHKDENGTIKVSEGASGEIEDLLGEGPNPPYNPDTDFSKMTHSERIIAGKSLGVKVAGRKKEDVIADLTAAASK